MISKMVRRNWAILSLLREHPGQPILQDNHQFGIERRISWVSLRSQGTLPTENSCFQCTEDAPVAAWMTPSPVFSLTCAIPLENRARPDMLFKDEGAEPGDRYSFVHCLWFGTLGRLWPGFGARCFGRRDRTSG